MRNWIIGWLITLRIMFFERETYRLLRDYSEYGDCEGSDD